MRARRMLALVAAGCAGIGVPALASGVSTATTTPLHCDRSHPAVAYYPGGRIVAPPGAPVPCGGTTGFASAENHLVALPDGSVVFTPAVVPSGLLGTSAPVSVDATAQSNASPSGMAWTRDRGAHWSFVAPSGVTWDPTDFALYVDRSTGRLFYEDYALVPPTSQFGAEQEGPAHINWSADSGRTWHNFVIATVVLPENPRFTAGVAPPGQARPRGYPHVVYFCADTNVGVTSPVIAGRVCFRSLDGGATWVRRSVLFSDATSYPECGNSPEEFGANDGKYPVAAPDGSLYVMVSCGSHAFLARSADEAKTFHVVHAGGKPVTVPFATDAAELRIAADGTFYLAYGPVNGAARPRTVVIYTSANRGRTWGRPINVTPPGITGVQQWAFDIASPDQLVLTYLARRAGQQTWDGYVTETRNARAALSSGRGPLFWSAQVNPANRPLLYGNDIEGAGQIKTPTGYRHFPTGLATTQGLGDEFIGATIAPDGTPWGSFTEDCGPSPKAAGCMADGDQTRGYAGYLDFSAAAVPHPKRTRPALAPTGLTLGVPLLAILLTLASLATRPRSAGMSNTTMRP